MKYTLLTLIVAISPVNAASVFISEFHYDNNGGDTGEFVEFHLQTGTAILDVTVTLYNGNGAAGYNTLSGTDFALGTSGVNLNGAVFDVYSLAISGIQNGSPDGIAISDNSGLVEFISYEGSFIASGGIANGITSTDIGVSQNDSTAIGSSITRTDVGWVTTNARTQGTANTGLTVNPIPEPSITLLAGLGTLTLLIRRKKSLRHTSSS